MKAVNVKSTQAWLGIVDMFQEENIWLPMTDSFQTLLI